MNTNMDLSINREYIDLEIYLTKECLQSLNSLGKHWDWLGYAANNNGKYIFSKSKKAEQFEALHKIFSKACGKFKEFNHGEIADRLSELVNNPPKF